MKFKTDSGVMVISRTNMMPIRELYKLILALTRAIHLLGN